MYTQTSTSLLNFPIPAALTLAPKAAAAHCLATLVLAATGEKNMVIKES